MTSDTQLTSPRVTLDLVRMCPLTISRPLFAVMSKIHLIQLNGTLNTDQNFMGVEPRPQDYKSGPLPDRPLSFLYQLCLKQSLVPFTTMHD